MTKTPAILVTLLLLLACCAKSAPPPAPPAQAPVAAPAAAPAQTAPNPFTLVELRIFDGADPGLMLHADGTIEMNHRKHKGDAPIWKPLGKISADGKIAKVDGTEVGALQADGTF